MDNFLIDKHDLDIAQQVCNSISDVESRNRAVANTFASNISIKFFEDIDALPDIESSLRNIPQILEELDISDIYIDGVYFDVRLFFDDNEISVPKSHFDNDMLPYAYMFIKINSDLSSGCVRGFIKPKDINTDTARDDKYYIDEINLKSYKEIVDNLSPQYDTGVEDYQIFAYLENNIDDKFSFYRELIHSYDARIKLHKAIKAQSIFNFISIPESFEQTPETSQNNYEIEVRSEDNLPHADIDNDLNAIAEKETISVNQTSNSDFQNYNSEDSINSLFNKHASNQEAPNIMSEKPKQKSSSIKILLPILITLIAGVGGYYGYNAISQNLNKPDESIMADESLLKNNKNNNTTDAMPIESVNKDESLENTEDGDAAVSIPAIEQNLDASVLVQNLRVSWEVPAGFAPTTSAQKYFINLGKIIQLNLKTEMLLMSKPPLTNRITVEIGYDASANKFGAAKIVTSSGEKMVDDLVIQTVNKAINMKSNISAGMFGAVEGNPILIIRF